MKNIINKKVKKVPLLTDKELKELGEVMHSNKHDELAKKRFWKKVYNDRGLEEGGIVNAD